MATIRCFHCTVQISLQSSEEEVGCLCEDAGLEKGHVETGLSEVVVAPLLGEMPLQVDSYV